MVDSIVSKGRMVRLESTIFSVGDNLASSHWSEWRVQVDNRAQRRLGTRQKMVFQECLSVCDRGQG